jgi:P27 family predicted phage terminase small subunit
MSTKIQKPAWLDSANAVREWQRIVKELGDKLTAVDASLLADYCQMYADCIDLRHRVEKEGELVMSSKGIMYTNPTLSILMNRENRLFLLRSQLYFTPKSRNEKQRTQGKARSVLDALDGKGAE